ncbi:MAG: ABC transporter permease [Rhodobacteraceae bacterium]|nr:ABC transporter permease [Paracoccaceae bacterium]
MPRPQPHMPPPPLSPPLSPLVPARRGATGRAILAVMLREMGGSHGRVPGGYLWALVQPVGTILLLVALFSAFLRAPPLGESFALFYATGFLPFLLFQEKVSALGPCLRQARPLLAYPALRPLDVLAARAGLVVLTQTLAAALILCGIALWEGGLPAPDPGRLMAAGAMAASLGLGLGVLSCLLVTLAPVWERIWAILSRPLLLVSGVLFLREDLPPPWREAMLWNPLVHITAEARAAFHPAYEAGWTSPPAIVLAGLAMLALGLAGLHGQRGRLAES